MEKLGTLFVVSTPIGNIGDMTYRAVEVLKNADLIACEDTRVSGRLLKEYQIKGKLTSFFEHNEDYKSQLIISELSQGKNVALISDAGTPLISDPGFKLVRMVRDLGFNVEAVPGACSPICALTLSGFPTDKFMFLGFLPAKDGKKEKILREYLSVNSTLIFFDSPHRIKFSIELLVKLGIKNEICVCREMTKKYQEVIIGTPAKVLEKLEAKDAIKGEIVLLIKSLKDEDSEYDIEDFKGEIIDMFKDGKTSKDIIDFLVNKYGFKKKDIFDFVNGAKSDL